MKYTAASFVALTLALCPPAFSAGGLECMNEPPSPACATTTTWNTCTPGFGQGVSLGIEVDTSNGNVRVSFAPAGQFPLNKPLTFYHNSRDNRWFSAGVGRTHSYNVSLFEYPDEWYPTPVRIVNGNGYRVSFDENIDGTFRGEPGVFSRLYKQADGSYILYSNSSLDMVDDGQVKYEFGCPNSEGKAKLRSVTYPTGTMTLTQVQSGYGVGEIDRIKEEATGKEVRFAYNPASRIETVTSLDNITTYFYYNNMTGDLTQVQNTWGTLTFEYDADHNIKTITDGLGGHTACLNYGASARGIEFRDFQNQVTEYNYTVDLRGNVTAVSFGPRGTAPTVYELYANRLLASVTEPGMAKQCYTYTADKCFSNQSYCALPQGARIADAQSSDLRRTED